MTTTNSWAIVRKVIVTLSATTLAIGIFASVAQARADRLDGERRFEIPSQSLATALVQFSKQAEVQLVTSSIDLGTRETAGVSGRLSIRRALESLLDRTGLAYSLIGDNTVAISARPDGADATRALSDVFSADRSASAAHAGYIHLAQAEPTPVPAASPQSASEASSVPRDNLQESVELGEVIVTGSHIRGVENNTVPLTVLDRAYIDSTGLGTTTRLIESLPQNFALSSQSATSAVPGNGGSDIQGSSVNLRGIGLGTTLVLLNGRRMAPGNRAAAVDISALPLSAIERVEVLTDGASALYGSDAVGGVVNFVLKSDFSGAETRLRSGWAEGGVNEYRLDQLLGTAWDSGNALVSLGYYKRDLLWAKDRDWTPSGSPNSLLPQDENYSALFSGQQRLSETLKLFAEALYTQRDTFNFGGQTTNSPDKVVADNPQLSATLGADWQIGADWQVEASGYYARNKLEGTAFRIFSTHADSPFEIQAARVKADGPGFSLPGGEVSLAIGAEWRAESFRNTLVSLPTGAIISKGDFDQIVRSAFGELYVPIIGPSNGFKGARRLELSLAGRLEDYSNFGSSFDPQVGVMWEPLDGLRLRGSRGSSFKAPNLTDYDTSVNGAVALYVDNPGGAAFPGLPSGSFHLLQLTGANPAALSAQEAQSLSFGVEFIPALLPGVQLGLNYYKIEYTGQIAVPAGQIATVALNDPSSYGSLLILDPSVAQVNQFIALGRLGVGFFPLTPDFTAIDPNFTAESVDVIVDLSSRNLSETSTRGLDVSMQYGFDVAGAHVQLGLAATHVSERVERVTATSAPHDTVDTIFNPADWRVRGSLGIQRQGWAANLFVNHTDSYVDNRTALPVPVSSWTTVDARLSYDFKESFSGGFLSGVSVSTFVQNLFDADPPRILNVTAAATSAGFDPTNADPMGRFLGVEITKSW